MPRTVDKLLSLFSDKGNIHRCRYFLDGTTITEYIIIDGGVSITLYDNPENPLRLFYHYVEQKQDRESGTDEKDS